MSILLRTLPYLKGHYLAAALAILVMGLEVAAQLLLPWAMKIVVDNVLGGEPLASPLVDIIPASVAADPLALLAVVALGGFLVTVAAHGFNVVRTYLQTLIDQGMVLRFRSALYRHVQGLSLAAHDSKRIGDIIHRINYSASSVGQVPVMVPNLLRSVVLLFGMFVVSFSISPMLSIVALAIVPFLFVALRYYSGAIQPRLDRVMSREIESLSIVQEALSMLRVVVAFGREEHEHRRFHEHSERTVNARVSVTVGQTLFSFGVNVIIAAGTAIVLGVGAYQVIQGSLTLGQLLVILAYIAAVYAPLSDLVGSATPFQQYIVDLRASFALLDEEPQIADAPGAVAIGRAEGRLEFDGVSFAHAGRLSTLSDISFTAAPGSVTAIVGPTGAGKTTLVSLLSRLYDPDTGRVSLDGRDVRDITVASLRRQFSVVLQDTPLFAATVRENIAYGDLDADFEHIVAAAQAAGAHDFVASLPGGYDTMIGEGGRGLSGGERQRIAIARAFLRDAPILILDEPTSAVDSRTEAAILDALERLMSGRTTFIIAHRLSTVRRADRILVLDHGRLAEQGAHSELMNRGGLYRRLHDLQGGVPAISRDASGIGVVDTSPVVMGATA